MRHESTNAVQVSGVGPASREGQTRVLARWLSAGSVACITLACAKPAPPPAPPPQPATAPVAAAPPPAAPAAAPQELPRFTDDNCKELPGMMASFDNVAAQETLKSGGNKVVQSCFPTGVSPPWTLALTFGPSGCLQEARFVKPEPSLQTATCVLEAFKGAAVSPFTGGAVTILASSKQPSGTQEASAPTDP